MEKFYDQEINRFRNEIRRVQNMIKTRKKKCENLRKILENMRKSHKSGQNWQYIRKIEKRIEDFVTQNEYLDEMIENFNEQQYHYLKLRDKCRAE